MCKILLYTLKNKVPKRFFLQLCHGRNIWIPQYFIFFTLVNISKIEINFGTLERFNGLLKLLHGTINANKEPLFFKTVYIKSFELLL